MSELKGYICLYRKMLENPIVCKDSDYLAVWVYLLLNATHKQQQALFKGKKIILQPGQLLTGRKSIAKKMKVNESKVTRILKTLEIEHQIEQQTCNKNRLISIVNWNKYQNIEHQNEQQVNNNRTTTEQQLNTNNNVNNVKNVNNVDNVYSSRGRVSHKVAAFNDLGENNREWNFEELEALEEERIKNELANTNKNKEQQGGDRANGTKINYGERLREAERNIDY